MCVLVLEENIVGNIIYYGYHLIYFRDGRDIISYQIQGKGGRRSVHFCQHYRDGGLSQE